MVLFILLLLVTAILVVFTVTIISVGGAVGIILFSDVIVCIALMVFIMKKLIKRRRK